MRHAVLWGDTTGGQLFNSYVARMLHEFVDPTSPYCIDGLLRIDIRCCTKGHSYMWADRALVPIKRYARSVPNGIVCGFHHHFDGIVDQAVKGKYIPRTYETCIRKSAMGGSLFNLHVVQLSDVLDFKGWLEDKQSIMVPKGRVFRSLDPDCAHEGPDFKLQQYCWLTAGTLDTVDHLDELWVRTAYDDTEEWTVLPLLRRKGKGTIAVTRDNIAEQRGLQSAPQPVRSQLGVLDALQSDDIHVITAMMDGQSGELEPVWPTIKGSVELTQRRKEKAAEKTRKKHKKLGIVLQQALTVPPAASRGQPFVAPAEDGAAEAHTSHVVRLEGPCVGRGAKAAAAADDDDDDDDDDEAEEEGPDSDDDGDDNDDDQGARGSGGGAGGDAKAVELPRVRVRIGRVFVPES